MTLLEEMGTFVHAVQVMRQAQRQACFTMHKRDKDEARHHADRVDQLAHALHHRLGEIHGPADGPAEGGGL